VHLLLLDVRGLIGCDRTVGAHLDTCLPKEILVEMSGCLRREEEIWMKPRCAAGVTGRSVLNT